jgi:uncharacterized protein YaaR (DUF327 family)
MEVQKVNKAGLDRIKPKQETPAESISFSAMMSDKKEQLNTERLNGMLKDIEDQGKRLSETVTVSDLRKYKQLVKQFMEEAVEHGLKLEERSGFSRRGRPKVYRIVTEVDKKLLELTDAMLKKQEKGIKILDLVGEIKGMLLNIYA